MDKNIKILAITILIVVIISFSAAFLLAGYGSNRISNLDKLSELYIYVPDGTNAGNVTTLPDGTSFNYTVEGTKYRSSVNDSLNVSFAIVNHEGHSMNYTILAYQSQADIRSPNSNFSKLFFGVARVMANNDTLTGWVNFYPAYASNNTIIGVALLDNQQSDNFVILNKTELAADIYT